MPLRRRLLVLVVLVLMACLVVGGALTYWTGLRKVDLEMSSAISVSESAIRDSLASIVTSDNPASQLSRIVRAFDGDRHVVARHIGPDGVVKQQSRLRAPVDPPPAWLYQLLVGDSHTQSFELPPSLQHLGRITLEDDPHNEIGEVWEDLKLKFLIISGFCGFVLALIYASLGRALKPLEDLSGALNRVGEGDYTVHVAEKGPEDLNLIYRAFNRMADRLHIAEEQNQRLTEQLSTVQEEERSEIARDLHDDIGPFLFAVDVDAQSIPLLLARNATTDVANRASAIRQSVQHMQVHLRGILSRLRPAMLIDQGLTHAIEHLVAFWRARHPAIEFNIDIENARYPAHIEEAAFRILQEGTNNAVRHGRPSRIGLTAKRIGTGMLRVVVSDNGSGIVATAKRGFGLAGMRERVTALNGQLEIRTANEAKGLMLIAEIPLPSDRRGKLQEDIPTPSAA